MAEQFEGRDEVLEDEEIRSEDEALLEDEDEEELLEDEEDEELLDDEDVLANGEVIRADKENISDDAAQKRIDRVADKAAAKAGNAVKQYDQENSTEFNK
jgi:hypothetical protein